ncbi:MULTISPECIES: hypothetical protein [Sphingobium]|uniref:hypothetical protein n=1 Tax=Sphingobium TaxID=165695 RepID=UPI0015EB40D8|nr:MULTISPECIES: hypothetical protein [Sphingobium]MCW2350148.1 hypothetical protein [Sphingobium sp. B12D2B]MCW2361508.1 hypothetical protein [Sphingobium sp. B10D3B]MCW2366694.1 hypothetical protein [Sphingobium sp. B7D2B]MCW2401813.1 hypothetical protein [Sphingobium sp. B10D7B]MCW2408792.1 hypothetical protein [Sphingobium xanthum]
MIALALLAAGAAGDQGQLQRQLDHMVATCRADQVVRLVAHGTDRVSFDMLRREALPSVSETNALQCALDKVRSRKDLQIGSTGNEARNK